jgi:hypothetical protein
VQQPLRLQAIKAALERGVMMRCNKVERSALHLKLLMLTARRQKER